MVRKLVFRLLSNRHDLGPHRVIFNDKIRMVLNKMLLSQQSSSTTIKTREVSIRPIKGKKHMHSTRNHVNSDCESSSTSWTSLLPIHLSLMKNSCVPCSGNSNGRKISYSLPNQNEPHLLSLSTLEEESLSDYWPLTRNCVYLCYKDTF